MAVKNLPLNDYTILPPPQLGNVAVSTSMKPYNCTLGHKSFSVHLLGSNLMFYISSIK